MLGPLLLVITAILWGLTFVCQRLGSDYIEAYTYNFLRFSISGFIMLIFYLVNRPIRRKKLSEDELVKEKEVIKANNRDKKLVIYGILVGVFLFIGATFQQIGITLTKNASKCGFISATYIVFVPIFCLAVFHDRIRHIIWLYLVVSLVGFFLISIKEGFSLEIGDVFTIISALGYAGQISMISRIAKRVNGVYLAFVQFLICGVLSMVFMLIFNAPTLENIIKALPSVMFAAIFSGCIAFTLQIYGQKYTDPTIASMIMSLESVFSLIFSMIILKEMLTTREFIGSSLIFLSIIFAQIDFKDILAKRKAKIKDETT